MKKVFLMMMVVASVAACKSKSSTEGETKNLIMLPDSSRMNNSYLTDTGKVSAAAIRNGNTTVVTHSTPTRNTGSSHSTSNTSTSTTTTSSASTAPAAAPAKKGWSKAAKGATIGGVGGAVAGAVIGHNAKGAIIGAAAGAAGGYIIGRGQDKKDGRVKH